MSKVYRILLIEDSPDDANLVNETLADSQYQFHIIHAKTMHEAIANHHDFDAIISDLMLPDTEGARETVQASVLLAEGKPVVVVTGLEDERVLREVSEIDGVNEVWDKDTVHEEDYDRLGRIISRNISLKRMADNRQRSRNWKLNYAT